MNAIDTIWSYFSQFRGVKDADLEIFLPLLKPRSLEKGEVFIEEGAVNRKIAFIIQGIVRAYHIKENGDEITTMLRWENHIVSAYEPILLDVPSRFYYQALEPTTLVEMNYDDLEKKMDEFPRFEKIRKFFLQEMLLQSVRKIDSFILESPEERYLSLLNENPDILMRVPHKYIANILGVTPVSLSRIKKRISEKR